MRAAILVTFLGVVASSASGQEPAASSNAVVTLGSGTVAAAADSLTATSRVPRGGTAKAARERAELAPPARTAFPARPTTQGEPNRPAAATGNWWTPLASLGLVLGLIVAGARLLRGYVAGSQPRLSPEVLQVLGSSQIEPKLTLHVVRWGSRLLLVGSGPQGARSLAEVSDAQEVERLATLCRARRPRAMNRTLRQVWNPGQGLGLRRRLTVPGEGRP